MRDRVKRIVAGGVLALGMVASGNGMAVADTELERLEVQSLCQAMPYRCPKGAATTIGDLRALDEQTMTPLTKEQVAEQQAKDAKALRDKEDAEKAEASRRIAEETRRESSRSRFEAEMDAIKLKYRCDADVDMARMAVNYRDRRRPLLETLKFQRSLDASLRALLLTQRIYSSNITAKQAADIAEASCLIAER